MKTTMLLFLILLNIFSNVYNFNKRFHRLQQRIFEGLDLDLFNREKGSDKKSTKKDFNILINIFDFTNRDQLKSKKNYYSILHRKISDLNQSKDGGGNVDDLYLLSREQLEERELILRNEKISRLIKNESNMYDSIEIDEDTEFYGHFDVTRLVSNLFNIKHVHKVTYKDISESLKFVAFNPPEIRLRNKPICIPIVTMIKLKNTQSQSLLLHSVFSDKYQVSIFYLGYQKHNHNNPHKNMYPKTILPGETLMFQVIILPETIGRIDGNIIFNFNRKMYVLYPIHTSVKNNMYEIKPVYYPNLSVSKMLNVTIEISNPLDTTLVIKEITNSIPTGNLQWKNFNIVSFNKTAGRDTILEIPAKKKQFLIELSFYKELEAVDYGLIQIKTDRDVLLIPVLVSFEMVALSIYPTYLDFGIIDLNLRVNRLIPFTVENRNSISVQIVSIFSNFDDIIEFIPNLLHTDFFDLDDPDASNCIIEPGEKLPIIGYFLLNLEKMKLEYTEEICKYGSLIIQTNFTNNPFIELEYSYCFTNNLFEYSVDGRTSRSDKNNFISLNYDLVKNDCVSYDIDAKFKNTNSAFKPFLSDPFYSANFDNYNISETNDYEDEHSKSFESVIRLQPLDNKVYGETLNLFLALGNPHLLERFYYLPFKSSIDNKYGIIPIKFNTYSLDFIDCDDSESFFECMDNRNYMKENIVRNVNLKENVYVSDFEKIETRNFKRKYFAFINQSEEDILIQKMSIYTDITLFELRSRGGLQRDEDDSNVNDFIMNEENFCERTRSYQEYERAPYECRIPPRTYFFFSIKLRPSQEEDIKELIRFYFDEDTIKFTILMTGISRYGRSTLSPLGFLHKPCFPSIIRKITSTFPGPNKLESFEKTHDRIIPYIIEENSNSQNNERRELMRVSYDPSKEFKYKYYISDKSIIDYSSKILTYKDYYIWRENEKLWEIMNGNGESTLLIGFNYLSSEQNYSQFWEVKARSAKPKLSLENELDFKMVNIGETVSKFIELFNPSSQNISVQLFIASDDFTEINRDDIFIENKMQPKNGMDLLAVMDCTFLSFSERNKLIEITNEIYAKNSKKNKSTGPNSVATKLSLVIELDENNSDGSHLSLSKSDLIEVILSKSSSKFKEYFTHTDRTLCDLQVMNRIEVLNSHKEAGDMILSNDFNKEIEIIRKMTQEQLMIKKLTREKVFDNKSDKIPNSSHAKITQATTDISTDTSLKLQEFYLPKSVSSNVYTMKPKSRLKIGPIIFNPKTVLNSTAVLFVRNNLTILYPIKLLGEGASGILTFSEICEETNSATLAKDGILNMLYDSQDSNEEFSVKVLRVTNSGNVQLDVKKILIENENSSINLEYYGSISLRPQENYDIKIFITPDFTSFLITEEIKFVTYTNEYSLIIQVELNQEVLFKKNPLFIFDNLHLSYRLYIMVMAIFIITGNIINTLAYEYKDIVRNSKKNSMRNFLSASSKFAGKHNSEYKFENLYIKSFRKSNKKFYDEFNIKEENADDKIIMKSKENLNKVRGKNLVKEEINSVPILDVPIQKENQNDERLVKNSENIEINNHKDIKEFSDNKGIKENIEIFSQNKPSTNKKQIKISNKKILPSNPIGFASKINEKEVKTDPEVKIESKKIYIPKEKDSISSKNDNHPNGKNSQNHKLNNNKEESICSPWDKKKNIRSFFEADHKQANSNSNYKSRSINKHTNNKFYKNYPCEAEAKSIIRNSQEILPIKNPEIEIIPEVPPVQPEVKSVENKIMLEDAKFPEKEDSSKTIIADTGEKSLEHTFAEENNLTNIGQKEGEEPLLLNPTLNQQFLSFDLKFLAKEEKETIRSKIDLEKKNDITALTNHINRSNYIVYDVFAENEPNLERVSQRNIDNNVIGLNPFKNYTNLAPIEPVKQELDKYSENAEESVTIPRVLNEDDANSFNYQSEKEKFDSGTEEFKFNFNSIFTQNNVRLIDHIDYKEETTDNEEIQGGNKPYFNRNIIFSSIDFSQSKSGIFSSNPFATNSNRKLLDELREENIEEDFDEVERKHSEKINFNEDEEEDPEWANEIVHDKEIGYFDETGTFKIKKSF